ncbi:Uncharacterised protein [Mycolicibacterium fortuitum]|uniref:Uncharacterized protein n=1 Tax=Mycolicibacterium fortuitum TaxID=1766 RepID=A0A378WCL2_MYCFO|nr:Uncharacterised protein [Mycolicibacterium fortuitum]
MESQRALSTIKRRMRGSGKLDRDQRAQKDVEEGEAFLRDFVKAPVAKGIRSVEIPSVPMAYMTRPPSSNAQPPGHTTSIGDFLPYRPSGMSGSLPSECPSRPRLSRNRARMPRPLQHPSEPADHDQAAASLIRLLIVEKGSLTFHVLCHPMPEHCSKAILCWPSCSTHVSEIAGKLIRQAREAGRIRSSHERHMCTTFRGLKASYTWTRRCDQRRPGNHDQSYR